MPDSQYFSKLRAFLSGRRWSQSTRSRWAKRRARAAQTTATFGLEPLEARVLLAADLAAAVQAAQVIEPASMEPQPAAVLLLDQETGGTNGSGTQDNAYGNLPLSFEANMGQTDSQVHYSARGDGYSLFLTDDGAVLSLRQEEESAAAVLTMEMIGGNPDAIITGEQLLPGVANYFIGNDPSQWRTDIPTYAQVQYDNIYAGIDLLYYGNQGQLEYDFVVAPGADLGTIQVRFTGADHLSLNEQGDLLLQVGDEQLTVQKPVLYQLVNGNRHEVSGNFVLNEDGTVGFQVGAYDPGRPLIIDPVLIYSTYFGGASVDRVNGLALDQQGNAYISGVTQSNNLPGAQARQGGRFDSDFFVTKLNVSGTSVLYTTYLGGTHSDGDPGAIDRAGQMVVDNAGNAYVGGWTLSSDFPTTAPNGSQPFDTTFNDLSGLWGDGVVAKLDALGALNYATFLGGNRVDHVNGIAVHGGQIYVTGSTDSASATIDFPTTPGAFQRTSAQEVNIPADAFVSKLNPAGNGPSDLVYSTLLSGGLGDGGNAIAVDQQGHAYVTGATDFHVNSFGQFTGGIPTGITTEQGFVPISGTFQDGPGGANADAFVTKVNLDGTGLIYSRYLGGNTTDSPRSIAIDGSGHAYVAGSTISTTFPVTAGAFQITPGGGFGRGFVSKLDPTGANLVYSTYVRGVGFISDIAVDTTGKIAVTGNLGAGSNFITTSDALQPAHEGHLRAIIAVLNPNPMTGVGVDPDVSDLIYASYLGGSGGDTGTGIAWDAAGALYVAGHTSSSDFPTTSDAFQRSPSFHGEAFVTKIGFNQAPLANADTYSVNEDTTLTVPARGVLANDTDADNNPLAAALVTGPASGTLTLNADGGFSYTPNGNFDGSDSFTYKANDGNADSNVATVSISVTSVNDPPTAVNDTATVDEDSGATPIPVLGNDGFAPDTGETLTITNVTPGSNGVVVITGNGTGLTYAPNANFSGPDNFTYTISDGNAGTATATVSMTVTSVNDPPIANAGPDQTVQGGTVTLDGSASVDLEDNTPLTFAWTLLTRPAGSAASLMNPTGSRPTFTPDVVGEYTAQLIVTDTLGLASTPDTVKISVIPLTVTIDIKPGSFPNSINLGAGRPTPVAIFSTSTFDARNIDPTTVILARAPVQLRANGTPNAAFEHVNGDGRLDLVVHFEADALQLSETDTQAVLEGRTFGGIFISGTDSVRVVQ